MTMRGLFAPERRYYDPGVTPRPASTYAARSIPWWEKKRKQRLGMFDRARLYGALEKRARKALARKRGAR